MNILIYFPQFFLILWELAEGFFIVLADGMQTYPIGEVRAKFSLGGMPVTDSVILMSGMFGLQ